MQYNSTSSSRFGGSVNNSTYPYFTLTFSQTFKNLSGYDDGYNSIIKWITPELPDDTYSFSTVGASFFRRSYVLYWEPCKLISEYDFTLTQEVKNSSSQLIVEGDVIVTAENTLIDSFPFTNFLTRRRGEREYLTVKMDKQRFWTSSNTVMTISGDTPFYENKNLVIQMSVDSNHYLSSYLTEVIFATGDQCIWGYNPESKDRFVMNVPNGISKWNVTLPGREIWFLAFSGPMMSDVQVDYLVVDDRQSDIPNSSFILYVDFKLMAVLIFLFIFLK